MHLANEHPTSVYSSNVVYRHKNGMVLSNTLSLLFIKHFYGLDCACFVCVKHYSEKKDKSVEYIHNPRPVEE